MGVIIFESALPENAIYNSRQRSTLKLFVMGLLIR